MHPEAVAITANGEDTRGEIQRSPIAILCLTALGVVYGDIGTSPLYSIRECFYGAHAVPVSHENVIGILSLIFWSLVIVVTIKYHVYVLRADNNGEGGILALMALARAAIRESKKHISIIAIGLFGAALLYGDGIITPAISVLSAVEGLEVATPLFKPYVVPITVLILVVLFLFQRRGTAGIGKVFGPITMVWFITLAVLGVFNIIKYPSVLTAVNPFHAYQFFLRNGIPGYLVLGAVFLCATGGEALYADLGHFGERAIQIDWFSLVAPSLLLNYFGQGALLISNPDAAHNPFYRMAPSLLLYPLVVLATLATIIASQAVISGVFSLTRQAVQLGFAPRVNIIHTSAREIGQIYIPGANWALMLGTIGLVLSFKNSSNLASAYGVAVTSTMLITTILAYFVTRFLWGWSLPLALLVTSTFLVVDLAFFGANIVKVAHGGWVPILLGILVYTLFSSWKRGRELMAAKLKQTAMPLEMFVQDVRNSRFTRVEGTAIFLTGSAEGTPVALLHNIKHNRVLHAVNIVLTVLTEEVPHVKNKNRVLVEDLGSGFYRVIVHYGFMEDPNVPAVLRSVKKQGLRIDPDAATYILSRNTLIPSQSAGIGRWRNRLFEFMSRNASRPTEFFRLPPNRVVELGMQIEI